METVIGGKGIEITPALRSFTENKLKKLDRVFNGVMDVHVTLSVQKYLQIADLTVKTRSGGFSATAQTTDMYASINDAIDNLVKQARRQKKRIKSRKGPKRGENRGAPARRGSKRGRATAPARAVAGQADERGGSHAPGARR